MKYIEIKNITKETFDELEVKLPVLPPGLGHFECKNPLMLLNWVYKFISKYGSDGILYLCHVDSEQVEGNKRYEEALKQLS